MRRLLDNVEARVIVGLLFVPFAGSLGIAIAEQFFDTEIKPAWNTPVVLASLYFIIRLVALIPDIGTDVKVIGNDVKSLVETAEAVRVERILNVNDFYASLTKAVDKATSTLDLTHIRDTPPNDFGPTAADFFNRVVDWCAGGEGRTVRRVISVRNPEMHIWAQQLAETTADLPQFSIRVIDWVSEAPAINFAIVDEAAVYLTLTGTMTVRTRGLAIDDEIVSRSFKEYYDNLWENSTDLRDWLALHPDEG